jgi:hypothetical protein
MLWAGAGGAGATAGRRRRVMAQDCTIPCNARLLRAALQRRFFGDQLFERLPAIGVALLVGLASPVVLLFTPAVTAIVLAGWCLIGLAIICGQAWLGAATPALRAMPSELVRLVEDNAPRIHPPRVAELRARAAALSLDAPNFGTFATRLLQDLREATGEAWRCPCPKRRLPF